MGIEIDNAYKTWIKEPKLFYRPIYNDKIEYAEEDKEELYEFYYKNSCHKSYSNEKFFEPFFNKDYFDIYIECSNSFIKDISTSNNINYNLKQWFFNHKDCMLTFYFEKGYNYIYVAKKIEQYTLNKWQGYDEIEFKECGKALYTAIVNLNNLYGLNLYPAIIDVESLIYYDEEEDYKLDNKIQRNISYLLDEIDNYFKTTIKKPGDKFFKDRNEKLKIIYDIIKQGGKMVYSF